MAWIDEVAILEDWLKNQPDGLDERGLHADLIAMNAMGSGLYTEGYLELGSGLIQGWTTAYRTTDWWIDQSLPPSLFTPGMKFPFDPKRRTNIHVSINISSGVIDVDILTFPQPSEVTGSIVPPPGETPGSFLISARSTISHVSAESDPAEFWMMILSLQKPREGQSESEFHIPTITSRATRSGFPAVPKEEQC